MRKAITGSPQRSLSAPSAGVDVAERLLREGGATPGHISSPSTGSTRARTSSTRRAPAMASRIGVALLAFLCALAQSMADELDVQLQMTFGSRSAG
jgi:hypothetical protein